MVSTAGLVLQCRRRMSRTVQDAREGKPAIVSTETIRVKSPH